MFRRISLRNFLFTATLLLLFSWSYLSTIQLANALDIKSAEERPCFKVENTVSVNILWAMTQTKWYYPVMSRMDLYAAAVEFTGKDGKDIPEHELYYDSCPTFEMGIMSLTVNAFNTTRKSWTITRVKGLEVFEFHDEQGKYLGTSYSVLTDNETFVVELFCLPNDQMTWAALSTQETLPKTTIKQIHDYVESLGFKREYFTGLRYDHCRLDDDGNIKTEL